MALRPRLPVLAALAAILAAAPGSPPAGAQDAPPAPGKGLDQPPPTPLTPEEEKEAQKLFDEAKAMVEKGGGMEARPKFKEFLKKYPGASAELVGEAEDRSGDNCLVGIELMHNGGPSARRIDVELMADGYTEKIFRHFKDDAETHMREFWKEALYSEYESYFNIWRFDLISKENGVDEMTPEEKGLPPPDPKKKPPKPPKHSPKQFSTALDCKQAGPQNQVWANPDCVMHWRRYLKESDGLTMAFANKGTLGMGGMGIATTGKVGAVVHEFGHAFVQLLDEYSGNPTRPGGKIFAPNAISTDNPDPRTPPPDIEIPWAHWLALKPRPKDVGVFLGGATFSTGVFKPASGCAMNAGGGSPYCTVCREQGVLRIYSYVSPLDESGPIADDVRLAAGESKEFFVQPMQPKSHDLLVDWKLQILATNANAAPPPPPAPEESTSSVGDERAKDMWQREGGREMARRDNPLPEGNPKGAPLKAAVKRLPPGPFTPTGAFRSTVKLEKLPPGVYRLTARVFDDTKLPRHEFPWVIKDTERLREEWRTWTVVSLPAASAPPPAPAPPAPNPPGNPKK